MKWILEARKWVKQNKLEAALLILVLFIAAFFRLYKIDQYLTFLGDEGRDAIVVRRLLVNFDPILIGPGTSIGNMYLGPLYYYLMAPALLLANFSPVGPAVMIALLGVFTVWFVWFTTKEFFPSKGKINFGALSASLLYAISPVIIIYSKSSWNPNIMPFFSLLCIYSLWRIWKKLELKWLLVLGVSFAFVLQSHYLGLLLLGPIGVFWLLSLLKVKNNKKLKETSKGFLKYSFGALFIFLFLMSPLVIFDARHGWQNFGAISKFFGERETTVSIKPWKSIPNLFPIWKDDFMSRIFAGKNLSAGFWVAFAIFDLTVLYFVKYFRNLIKVLKNNDEGNRDNFISSVFILSVWLLSTIVGLALYKQHIYDHYFGLIYAAPFMLFGGFFIHLWDRYGKIIKGLLVSSLLILVYVNLLENPLRYPPNGQMQRAQAVSEKIKLENSEEKFNLAVIAKQNYEDGYQYFLEKDNQPVFDIDPLKLDETIATQLFVVCEMPKTECDPTHSPKAEIANFGWSKIDGEWEVQGITIYKLVHSI